MCTCEGLGAPETDQPQRVEVSSTFKAVECGLLDFFFFSVAVAVLVVLALLI